MKILLIFVLVHQVRNLVLVSALAGFSKATLIIYIVLFLLFAGHCFRKGHWMLGLGGFIFPAMWIIGAILPSKHPIVHVTRR